MKWSEDLLGKTHGFLKQSPVFSSFPPSLLLIGLEELMEKLVFVCPCKVEQNLNLTVSMFTGPALFIFVLMFLVLRPFKHGCNRCCSGANDDTQQNCPKAFASCLIPPVMWIFILLLDGDYVACAKTNWNGVFGFDMVLNRSWCKPIEGFRNETDLQHLVQQYVNESQFLGYVMIGSFSALAFTLVTIYDCCISGKCDWCCCCCCCCKQTAETQNERQGPATMGLEMEELGSSITAGQDQKGSGSSAIVVERQEESRGSATTGHGLQASGSSSTMGSK